MATLTRPDAQAEPSARRVSAQPQIRDATSPLVLYVGLLVGLPSGLIFEPLGAAGTPASVLGMCFLAWWLYARLVPRLGVFRGRQPIRVGLYAFLLSAAASFLAGVLRPMTSAEASSSTRGVLTVCAWAGVVLVTADGLRTRESLDRVLRFVVWAGTFLAVLGLIQFFSGWNPATLIQIPGLHMNTAITTIARDNFTRVQGTAAHAIEFGVVLAMILPLALHYAWFATERKKQHWAAVGAIGLVLPMTVSRSAIIGLAIVLIVMIISWPPERRRKVYMVLPFAAVALKLLVPGLLGALKGLFANFSNDPSTQGRTDDFAAVGFYVHQSPWFGRGLSTFIPELYRTLDNAYLGWAVEAGLVGLFVLIGFLVLAVGLALNVRSRAPGDASTRDLASALAAGMLAAIFNFATFDALGFAMCAGTFFLLVGATGALWRLAPPADLVDTRTLPRVSSDERVRRNNKRLSLACQLAGMGAGAALAMAPGVVQTTYSTSASVQLFGPSHSTEINPYVSGPYLDVASEIVQRLVMSPETKHEIEQEGLSSDYTVAAGKGSLMAMTDKTGTGALIYLNIRAPTPEMAIASRDAVVKILASKWRGSQAAAGAPVLEFLPVRVASSADVATPMHGNKKKAMAVAGWIGFAAGGIFWFLLSKLLRARARRKRGTSLAAAT